MTVPKPSLRLYIDRLLRAERFDRGDLCTFARRAGGLDQADEPHSYSIASTHDASHFILTRYGHTAHTAVPKLLRKVFDSHDLGEGLKPIYDLLEGAYSYDELHLYLAAYRSIQTKLKKSK